MDTDTGTFASLDPTIITAIETLNKETKTFIHTTNEVDECNIEDIENDPIIFCRDYASKNVPLLIKGGCLNWQAVKKWDAPYFLEELGEQEVTVAVTPNGYADGLVEWDGEEDGRITVFARPEERRMRMYEFLEYLYEERRRLICRIPHRSDSFNEAFQSLLPQINELEWATKAFNIQCKKTISMSDGKARTHLHKHPFDNLYCVIDGYKDFVLIPATDYPLMPFLTYRVATYQNVAPTEFYELLVKEDDENIIENYMDIMCTDPLDPDYAGFPDFEKVAIYKVRARKGDILYVPSLWYHQTSHSHGCIDVCYWYNMVQDLKYCYYVMLEKMIE